MPWGLRKLPRTLVRHLERGPGGRHAWTWRRAPGGESLLPGTRRVEPGHCLVPPGQGSPAGTISVARAIHDPHVDRPEHPRRGSDHRAHRAPTRSLAWGSIPGGRFGHRVTGATSWTSPGRATPSASETHPRGSAAHARLNHRVRRELTVVARRLRIGRAGRRSDARLRDRHSVDLTTASAHAQAAPISLPITRDEVVVIASAGFPLWEPLDTLQLRNHRITLAYGDLSHQLSRLTAGNDDEGPGDANWCTFATWSSRTIGTCIDRKPEHGLIHHLVRRLPASVATPLLRVHRSALVSRARSYLPDIGRRQSPGIPRDRYRRQPFHRVLRSGGMTDLDHRL